MIDKTIDFTKLDVIEMENRCARCKNFICYVIQKWLIPESERFPIHCEYEPYNVGLGYRCTECYSKWHIADVREECGEEIDEDEIDLRYTAKEEHCDYCQIVTGFFLTGVIPEEEQARREAEYQKNFEREKKKYPRLYDSTHCIRCKVVCLNCRGLLN